LDFFAGHRRGHIGLDQIRADILAMGKREFADKYISDIDMNWKRRNPKYHTNWLNPEKVIGGLCAAGFKEVAEMRPFETKFEEMRGVGKYWGFDHRQPSASCYIEAQKTEV
jgi:hypothetical protein